MESRPPGSLAVEDSSNGVRAAAAAGLTVIALAHEEYPLAPDAVALSHRVRTTLGQVRDDIMELLDEQEVGMPKR